MLVAIHRVVFVQVIWTYYQLVDGISITYLYYDSSLRSNCRSTCFVSFNVRCNCKMKKKIVKYDSSKFHRINVGSPAIVFPLNHTSELVSNTKEVITSFVISKSSDGSFETENTIYVHV